MMGLNLFDLSGRKAFVTGAAGGIGLAVATALAHAGADVAIVDRNEAQAKKAAASIAGPGRKSLAVRCDVTDSASVQAMIETVVSEFGQLDIAVNNAGIYIAGSDEDQTQEEWDRVINVNLTGTWLCARAAMRQMVKQKPTEGKIINIGSIGASIACSNGSYDASKAAVVHLTRGLAARWGAYNINVNSISPGYIGRAMTGINRPAQEREQIRAVTPLGYVQRLQDLHGPAVFLASRASDFVTGQNLVVDGGHTLSTWMMPLTRGAPPRVDVDGEIDALD